MRQRPQYVKHNCWTTFCYELTNEIVPLLDNCAHNISGTEESLTTILSVGLSQFSKHKANRKTCSTEIESVSNVTQNVVGSQEHCSQWLVAT